MPSLVPGNAGEHVQSHGVRRADAECPAGEPLGGRVLARIGKQLLGKLTAENRVGRRSGAGGTIKRQTVVAPAQLAEARELGELEVDVVGEGRSQRSSAASWSGVSAS